ncbi:MAG: N-acetylneuraminate synthase family protein [Candidatus Sulfotelmatobacter sp.]|jgi:N,N'-diacetyllegionaminate synthase
MRVVRIGQRWVGEGQPCFLAAEVGINHNGDMDLAHRSIDAAADAGADAVKFQNYRTEDFISDRSLTYEYVSQGKAVVEPQYDMFKRCELAPEKLLELREHCDRRGVVFFSTPTSEKGVQDLIEVGAPLMKNGSDYLVHLPLIRAMARTGLPTVISTGMATLDDVKDAVEAFRVAGGRDLILLHCTSSYPTPPEDVHLRKIAALSAAFDCPVGLSDHTDGIIAAIGSVALGACMIEKHYTLDKNLPGPDHRFSATPDEFRALVDAVRILEESMGEAELKPAASEELTRRDSRLSCVAARELPAGHRLVDADIAFKRPGFGFAPKELDRLVARELVKDVPPGHVFSAEDFAG